MEQQPHYHQDYPQDFQEYQYPQQEYNYDYPQEFDYDYSKDYGLPSEPNVMRTKRMGHRKALSNSYMTQKPTHKRTGSGIDQPPALVDQSQHRRFHSVSGIQMEYMQPQSPMTPPPVMYQQQMSMMNPMYDYRGHQKSMSNASMFDDFTMMKMEEKPRGRPLHPLMHEQQLDNVISGQFDQNSLDFSSQMYQSQEQVFFDDSKDGIFI
jgi:hypothetical protein